MNTKQFSFLHDLIFRNKWSNAIFDCLGEGPLRFKDIREQLPLCSAKMLAQTLTKLVENKTLIRVQYTTMPLKVTYEINPNFLGVLNIYNQYYTVLSDYIFQNEEVFNIPAHVVDVLKAPVDSFQPIANI